MIIATGGPGMVKAAYSAGKPALGVGAGNSPSYIERTADVAQSVKEILASKTGIYGMIGGQTVDVELAGGPIPKNKLDFIYRLKTGALIEASMLIGAVLGGAAEEDCKIVESLAGKVGLAFQIQDDILDVTGDQEVLGKEAGSDEKNQKTTYVTLEGLEKAKKDVEALSVQAIEDLNKLPGNNEFLENLIRILIKRQK